MELRGPGKVAVQIGHFEQKLLPYVRLQTFICFSTCLGEICARDKQRYVYAAWNGQKR